MFDPAAHELLAVSSVRRLLTLRHCSRHGSLARTMIRLWLDDLRRLRGLRPRFTVRHHVGVSR
jgi:hypothetical protein